MKTQRNNTINNQESGAVFVLVAAALIAVLGMTALVVDISRTDVNEHYAQNTADAIALAGAKHLDGTLEGWRIAKRSALGVIRKNRNLILGLEGSVPSDFVLTEGIKDPVENPFKGLADSPNMDYAYTEGEIGNMKITVERGTYWDEGDGFQFVSLEGETEKYHLPMFMIANAVRVKLQVRDLPTVFSKMFGILDFDVNVASTALFDTGIERCVAPFAIPACSLLANLDPYSNDEYTVDAFDPKMQCQREVYITEVSSQSISQKRREGLARYESYIGMPLFDLQGNQPNRCGTPKEGQLTGVNCTALPVRGAFGKVRNDGSETATAGEVREVINGNRGCHPARLGSLFRPLEAGSEAKKLLKKSTQRAFAEFLKGGDKRFHEAFCGGDQTCQDVARQRPNFPRLRRLHEDKTESPEENGIYKELENALARRQ